MTNKHYITLLFSAALLTATMSCNKGRQNRPTVPATAMDSDSIQQTQTTVFGICGDDVAMNTLQLLTDSGDTLNLSIERAKAAGQVKGSYEPGDRMAVVMNDKHTVKAVINETVLMGNWVMPNPLDGSSTVGIRIKDGGIAESIEQPSIIYKTWKIVNGQLELTMVREGGGDMEESETFAIQKLDADSLIISNEADHLEFGREKQQSH